MAPNQAVILFVIISEEPIKTEDKQDISSTSLDLKKFQLFCNYNSNFRTLDLLA